jgi:hypothetical protein
MYGATREDAYALISARSVYPGRNRCDRSIALLIESDRVFDNALMMRLAF